jgi:flagellar basal-body rod modification protein FlgD
MPLSVRGTQDTAVDRWTDQAMRHLGSLEDQFMRILITQLKYQDPIEPVNEREFFAQMAQFTTATQVQNLNSSISLLCSYLLDSHLGNSLLQAANLIGKRFEAVVSEGTVTGVIESVGFSGGRLVVFCQGKEYPVDSLTWIGGADRETEQL